MIFSTLRLWKRACNVGQDMARSSREDLVNTLKHVSLLLALLGSWKISGSCTTTLDADSCPRRAANLFAVKYQGDFGNRRHSS